MLRWSEQLVTAVHSNSNSSSGLATPAATVTAAAAEGSTAVYRCQTTLGCILVVVVMVLKCLPSAHRDDSTRLEVLQLHLLRVTLLVINLSIVVVEVSWWQHAQRSLYCTAARVHVYTACW
jgi:hypothetical protein